jgi:hypothetical protein
VQTHHDVLRGGGPVHAHGIRTASGTSYDHCCTSSPRHICSSRKPHTRRGLCLSWLVLATMLVGWTSPCRCRSSSPGGGRASLPGWVSSWSGWARVRTQLTFPGQLSPYRSLIPPLGFCAGQAALAQGEIGWRAQGEQLIFCAGGKMRWPDFERVVTQHPGEQSPMKARLPGSAVSFVRAKLQPGRWRNSIARRCVSARRLVLQHHVRIQITGRLVESRRCV